MVDLTGRPRFGLDTLVNGEGVVWGGRVTAPFYEMRPLIPVGGIVDHRLGILTAPNHAGVPIGIRNRMDWAADLGCQAGPDYVKRWNPTRAFRWLYGTMAPHRRRCLFVAGFDVVGDAKRTIAALERFKHWMPGWPLAFCAQDGQESLALPVHTRWSTLFIGGTTEWKLSEAAYGVIQEAQRLGKHIHIGRVNWWKRYAHFAGMPGSEEWTFDGTRTRYDGTQNTISAWLDYMDRPVQARFSIPLCDHGG